MKKIRKFLKRNEIFFTTISAALLGVMAIIISYKSIEISEKQYQMDYFENHPEFLVKLEESENGFDGKIVVTKQSGKAKNIHISIPAGVLHMEEAVNCCLVKSKAFLLTGNFIEYESDNYEKGFQKIIKGKNNILNANMLQHELTNRLQKRYGYSSFAKVHTYIKISYLNFENKQKNEYYHIWGMSDVGQLMKDTTVVKKYFNGFFLNESQKEDVLFLNDIEKMDIENIMQRFEKSKTQSKKSLISMDQFFM